jgi:hypothetical protein
MIKEPQKKKEEAKVVLPQRDQVFRILLHWRVLALVIAFPGPFGLRYLVASQDMIPGDMRYLQSILDAVCIGIAVAGLYFFALTSQWLRVNQAGIQFSRGIIVRAMPWDELLAYDVSVTMNCLEIMDIRGRSIRVNCNLYESGMIDILNKYVAGNRERAFEHIERRGLRCPVKSRSTLGIVTMLFSAGCLIGLSQMGTQYAPTLLYQVLVYNFAQAICLFSAFVAFYKITATVKVDRFTVTKRALLTKEQISFSQVIGIEVWRRVLESDTPIEVLDITGRDRTAVRITQYARNYKLIRDYIIAKSQLAAINDRS